MKHWLKRDHRLWIDFGTASEEIRADYPLKTICRAAIEETLDYEGFQREAEVSVTFCDNAHIRGLNRTYREKDAPTDVLSFPQYEPGEALAAEEDPVTLGDIVISLERAREQAKEIGHPFLHEVAFLCIHSTLHLLGYDHEISPAAEEEMFSRQRAIVARLQAQLKVKEF